MTQITYITGDVTEPLLCGNDCIVQVVNNVGAYGAGVSGAIAKKWPRVKESFDNSVRALGIVNWVQVEEAIFVGNMYAQNGLRSKTNQKPLRYGCLAECLLSVRQCRFAYVHMPKIGCGLAGGDWNIVSEIIQDTLVDYGVEVYVYELPAPKAGTGKQP